MVRFFHPLFSAGLLAVLAMLFVAACGASSGPGEGSGGGAQQEGSPQETGETSGPEGSGNPTLGAADAPVVMVEWGDFQ